MEANVLSTGANVGEKLIFCPDTAHWVHPGLWRGTQGTKGHTGVVCASLLKSEGG